MDSLRILMIGAGAIGCFVGGRLASAGHAVTLVGRARTAAALQTRGLQLYAADGALELVPSVNAVASVQEAFPDTYDIAVLAVKSYDTATVLDLMAPLEALLPQAILSLQNGVGNEEQIAARFGPQRVLAGTTTAPVEVKEPGIVQVTKPNFAIGLADFPGGSQDAASNSLSPLLYSLSSSFSSAGLPTMVYDDAGSMKWSKLLMNMIGNATSAILAEPPGVTFADPRIADLEIDALREALRVMVAAGIRPLNVEKYPLRTLAPFLRWCPRPLLRTALHRVVGGARGGKMPSLFLDLEQRKRGSEVAWYNGAIVRKGVEVGVATPVNRLLTETVRQLAAEPQLRADWRGNFGQLAAAAAEEAGS
ncbi:MAG: 2-dehydropantoate 2-reductase [Caldilineaceae bacterium SB0670_bin_27]|uniref:2-dehydropantoate 2-reductase n=1 Tax=Caldilineaceae bacterium SB0664_bin_27 TaxID=2605260 RepID=A0A6B0YMK2_9CHLR|nr:2-dehydropantoate 2-reductase [Caldilineaceae bacterium SB0664_bin_27]MYJ78783.1 2-dehydropantoate 2-reductase [Caldilineaceae bacterium SB0670_bin_27]